MSMIIDGVFASEAIDSSGEILDVEGCDISDMEQGSGVLNWEHRGDDAAGASANDIIGKVVFCKKIFGPEDCTDSRQLEYWQKIQLPMIYGICRLFDGSGHPGAIAAAAMIRDYQKNGEPLLIRYSIEGTTLEKEKGGNRLLRSIARRVAATIKPCNKSCHSGVIADPNDPTVKKQEHAHPNFTPLGGSMEWEGKPEIDSPEIRKALEAGNYNSAPGTLTGGSALQREDAGLRNRVKAAVRDWDRKTPFRKFLKHRLPEASDGFIDRFADLVHDYTVKKALKETVREYLVKKIVEKAKAAPKAKASKPAPEPKAAKAPKAAKPAPAPAPEPESDVEVESDGPLTIKGKPVQLNPGIEKPHFDENTGVLHTPRGSFPLYIPSRDRDTADAGQKFANIMADPKVEKFHDYAMENWAKVHQHLKAGTLPPEVVMHGVLFSQLSPNTPVPMQEMMYAHLVDSMKATGADPRQPGFSDKLKQDWFNRDQPQKFPDHSPEHWARLGDQLRNKIDSKLTGRKAGEIGGFMLANNKMKNMDQYHSLHNSLTELIGRHRADARSGVEELMHHKTQAGNWENKRRLRTEKGQTDIGPYTAGPSVPGLATKTARYTYGMLGGGNVTVPDTHFSRYLFGLDKRQDGATIRHLRNEVLWNPNNAHIMGAIDRYYGQHHDAVKHMLQHPRWGHLFKDNPEDAIFPAFWKNWVGIVPHEASRGMKTGGFNEATDHRPFWDAVGPYMNKSETGIDTNLAAQTAKTHAQWVEKYGEMPALLMYFHYLVPQLLASSEKAAKAQQIVKFEEAAIELSKADSITPRDLQGNRIPASQAPAAAPRPEVAFDPKVAEAARQRENPKYRNLDEIPETVQFGGKTVKPGHGYIPGGKQMAFFGATPEHLIGVPRNKAQSWTTEDLMKIPRASGASVQRYPEELAAPSIVSHAVHGVPEYTHHDDVRNLVDGLDFDAEKQASFSGINQAQSFWTVNKGHKVYVKANHDESDFDEPSREGLYHNLARDFFGMGKYVTPTGVVLHPRTGQKHAVIENVAGGEHLDTENPEHKQTMQNLMASGELHKMTMMNVIAANHDRHRGNFMMTPGGLKLIDHGYAFADKDLHATPTPDYIKYHDLMTASPNDPRDLASIEAKLRFHPEAAKWLQALDPQQLDMQMRRHGVPERYVDEARRRLVALQHESRDPKATIVSMMRAPFHTAWVPPEERKGPKPSSSDSQSDVSPPRGAPGQKPQGKVG